MLSNSQLNTQIHHILTEMQAQNIVHIDVSQQTSITDDMYICTGRSSRHVIAIAEELSLQLKKSGFQVRSSGTQHGEWALIDCGDAIVHVMQAEVRMFYNLEELWLRSC